MYINYKNTIINSKIGIQQKKLIIILKKFNLKVIYLDF